MRGGHHGAFCTFLAEVAHKYNIKLAAKLARTYGNPNASQDEMLKLMLTHEIYEEVLLISSQREARGLYLIHVLKATFAFYIMYMHYEAKLACILKPIYMCFAYRFVNLALGFENLFCVYSFAL